MNVEFGVASALLLPLLEDGWRVRVGGGRLPLKGMLAPEFDLFMSLKSNSLDIEKYRQIFFCIHQTLAISLSTPTFQVYLTL